MPAAAHPGHVVPNSARVSTSPEISPAVRSRVRRPRSFEADYVTFDEASLVWPPPSASTSLQIRVAVGSLIMWVSCPEADFACRGSCSFLLLESLSLDFASESARSNIYGPSASHLQILPLAFPTASAVPRSRSASALCRHRRRPGRTGAWAWAWVTREAGGRRALPSFVT